MRRSPPLVALLVPAAALLAAACPGPQCEEKTNLLQNDAWTQVAPADDPFLNGPITEPDEEGHYPPDDPGSDTPHNTRDCTAADFYSEDLDGDTSLTVDTNVCGWLTVEQTLGEEAKTGDTMFARIFYFQQIAPGISEAHLALTVDGKPFFKKTIPLPAPSDLIAEEFPAPMDARKGARLMWHLDNHGANTWNLLEISKTTPVECPK